ncbi:MAG: glycosyltransferase family 2 protein [Candidatus Omnitrophota bacterium]|nr:glycosyltransferase family 2 protein [Candidatus Omnitrophota bacterium]
MKCDIVIPVWNMKELTRQCVDNIVRHTDFPYCLIIVDNASNEETRIYLEDLAKRKDINVRLIRNEENLGNSKGANQGIRASDAEYVCILDNDTMVMGHWLTEMVNVAESDEKIGVVNPVSNYGRKKPLGRKWEEVARDVYQEGKGKYIETAAAIGFCFLIKRKVINDIGVWPEGYGPGYFEDTEYSIRAIRKGYKVAIAQGAYVVHLEHSSFRKTGFFDELFAKNQKIFYDQFGKSKRLLYILTGENRFGLDENAYENAQNRNWIWVFTQKGSRVVLPDHAYIKLFYLDRPFFEANCIFRILRRKKRFDTIYSDSPSLVKKLNTLKGLHGAEVVHPAP